MRLEGKVALVTGAGGGIGAATCERLAAEGAEVAATDLQGADYVMDVRDTESVRKAVAAVEADLGPVDVLVNNAGIADDDFFTRTTEDQWDRVIAVNLRGVMAVTHAVLPGMHQRGGGSIVNVASEAGRVGSQMSTVYSATKAGVIGFTKALAKESARYHVRVNAVAPGPIDTDMLKVAPDTLGEIGERFVKGMVASTAMGRPGRPEEVAAAIAYLAGEDASFVTGETIGVSGGLGMM
jgi:2-hydroxycyclohexanecarboxyl-CoA dehydrogenase